MTKKQKPGRAGTAFLAAAKNDPKTKAALKRAQAKLQAFANDIWPEIAGAIEQQRQRLRQAGFPVDGSRFYDEVLEHVSRIVERDPKGLTADEIERWAMAWLDRERIRLHLGNQCDSAPDNDGEPQTMLFGKLTHGELAKKHGLDADKLRKRLDTWRVEHDSGYIEAQNRKPQEPKYLYDESAVMPVISAAKKRAADRQRKKIRS